VLFPRKAAKPKKGEATKEELKAVSQIKNGPVLPFVHTPVKAISQKITAADAKITAFATLRQARADARLVGIRKKKSAEKKAAKEAAAQK